jgi:hypothetical protein
MYAELFWRFLMSLGTPLSVISPDTFLVLKALRIFSREVFPQPEGPTIEVSSHARNSPLMFFKTILFSVVEEKKIYIYH